MHLYWQHYKPSLVGFYLVIDDTNLESCSVIAVADPLLDTFLWEVGEQTGVASAPLGCSLTTDFSPPDAAERTKPLLHAAVNHLISACGAQVPALPPVSPPTPPSASPRRVRSHQDSAGLYLPACLLLFAFWRGRRLPVEWLSGPHEDVNKVRVSTSSLACGAKFTAEDWRKFQVDYGSYRGVIQRHMAGITTNDSIDFQWLSESFMFEGGVMFTLLHQPCPQEHLYSLLPFPPLAWGHFMQSRVKRSRSQTLSRSVQSRFAILLQTQSDFRFSGVIAAN